MPPVYFIASYDIIDPLRYERSYVPALLQTLAAAGGEVVIATGSAVTIEGVALGQTVVLRFPSEAAFREWYDSDEHEPVLELRRATTSNSTAVLANEFRGGGAS